MIGNKWDEYLKEEIQKDYFQNLLSFIKEEYKKKTIYPKQNEVFNAFRYTDFDNVKVVILGQDPYHGEGEAHGYAFSCLKNPIPPSLKNIYKELESDLGINPSLDGDLTKWAKEGVLLLNATLTVKKDSPNSHSKIGWEPFTDYVIRKLNCKEEPIVFILWGNFAKSKKKYITNPKHLIIESSHPSPYSASYGFFGSKPFSRTNNFLIKNNIKPINWQL